LLQHVRALMPDVQRLAHLRDAKDLMDRDYAEALDLDAIARAAGYSRFHFIRAFRDAYGQTPRDYLSARRVERARELLRNADLTVTEVCLLVGFSSLGSFSTRFRKKGVQFLQEPADRPYGIEAVFRDDSGNWFSLTERKPG